MNRGSRGRYEVSSGFFGGRGGQNRQQGLGLFCGVTTQAGQVAAIWLVDQFFLEQALGSSNGSGSGGLVDFQTFLGATQGKSARISSSATNSGVYDIRTPDVLGIVRR